jgi:hypothetical protein
VHENIVIENKDSLYANALENLASTYSGNPESALVDYYRAELLMKQAAEWSYNKESPHRYAYNKALEICRDAIKKFPAAYGSQLCQNLIAQIESKTIQSAVENISLPGEELLVQIEYRNLSAVNMKVVKLPEAPRRWRGENWNGEEILNRLMNYQPSKAGNNLLIMVVIINLISLKFLCPPCSWVIMH